MFFIWKYRFIFIFTTIIIITNQRAWLFQPENFSFSFLLFGTMIATMNSVLISRLSYQNTITILLKIFGISTLLFLFITTISLFIILTTNMFSNIQINNHMIIFSILSYLMIFSIYIFSAFKDYTPQNKRHYFNFASLVILTISFWIIDEQQFYYIIYITSTLYLLVAFLEVKKLFNHLKFPK